MNRLSAFCALALLGAAAASAQNPILPLWEYIPDGEPYVFEDPDNPGKYRVYIYGSHDVNVTSYCGHDLVTWSAPLDSLADWRYDGVIFSPVKDRDGNDLNHDGSPDLLYAPDVARVTEPDGTVAYYLYPNDMMGGRNGLIARSTRPDGPFEPVNWSPENPKEAIGVTSFDPGVLVDDDGRVYGFWGFERSYAAELDPATMCTVKPGTEIIEDLVPGWKQDTQFRFFEASSPRKIGDKYVLVYSRFTNDGEFGLPIINYTLAYAYADSPLGPYTYGGTIIDGRARGRDAEGTPIPTACPWGNTHGGLCEINGRWWIFYHRQTGKDEYSRQAMVAPVEISVEPGAGGKVYISEGEVTSEGFMTSGLDPFTRIEGGRACLMVGPGKAYSEGYLDLRPYIEATRSREGVLNPVVNITSGSEVGFKYLDFDRFGSDDTAVLNIDVRTLGYPFTVAVYAGDTKIGEKFADSGFKAPEAKLSVPVKGLKGLKGKQPLCLKFTSPETGTELCRLNGLVFAR